MKVRRKVFSILTNEAGEERLYSVNETLYEEQREFGSHKRKQNRKLVRELKYQEINESKALKAKKRSEELMSKGNTEAAKKAEEKALKKSQESLKNAQRFDERVSTVAKTRKSIDSIEGLDLKKEGKLHNTTTNIKRDLAGNQTTAVQNVVSKNDVIPGTTEKVMKKRSVSIHRNPETHEVAKRTKKAQVATETVKTGYKGGVNNNPVIVEEVKKVVTPTENGTLKAVEEVTKKSKRDIICNTIFISS